VAVDLLLFQYTYGDAAGFASGGFMGNSRVSGQVLSGSQQQWMTRHVDAQGGFPQGVWNMVFVGSPGAPDAHCGNDDGAAPFVTLPEAPTVLAEKPFITIDEVGLFYLNVPEVASAGRAGADWTSSDAPGTKVRRGAALALSLPHRRQALVKRKLRTGAPACLSCGGRCLCFLIRSCARARGQVPFSEVFVASAEEHDAAAINAALSGGLHVVLAPGIFHLDAPLTLSEPGQVG